MAHANSFPVVRGRTMRVTEMDTCGTPVWDSPAGSVVTDGFVSVALTANITDAEEIVVTNANGETCVRDPGCPTFNGYSVDLTFCEVQPCLLSLLTGQPPALDALADIIGFKMNSKISVCDVAFGLEVWMNVPGGVCDPANPNPAGVYGYLILPYLQGGTIGDFTVENAAINFTVTGAETKDGNNWDRGPYRDTDHALDVPLDPFDHLQVTYSQEAPPATTDGCVAVPPLPITLVATQSAKAPKKSNPAPVQAAS